MNRYTFRRYRDGELKAEGAVVDAESLFEAQEKVRRLGGPCSCEAYKWTTDTFEVASAELLRATGTTPAKQYDDWMGPDGHREPR